MPAWLRAEPDGGPDIGSTMRTATNVQHQAHVGLTEDTGWLTESDHLMTVASRSAEQTCKVHGLPLAKLRLMVPTALAACIESATRHALWKSTRMRTSLGLSSEPGEFQQIWSL